MKLVQIGEHGTIEELDELPAPPLPDLQDAILSSAQLDALFADLAEHATIGEIILKGGATQRANPRAKPSLEEALAALRAGTTRGVQIRYLHEGSEWWDTLMRTQEGVRLVRIEH